MKNSSKNKKLMALLLILSMLTPMAITGAFSVDALWDGIEQSANSPVVLYNENAIANDMEVPENAVLTIRYELEVKLPTESGAEYILPLPENLTAIEGVYDICGYAAETYDPNGGIMPIDTEPADIEYYIGTMLVSGDYATITFFEQSGGETLSVNADIYCNINMDAVTEADENGNRRVTLTSGGADVSLIVTDAVEFDIMALDEELPGFHTFSEAVNLLTVKLYKLLSAEATDPDDPEAGYELVTDGVLNTDETLRIIYYFVISDKIDAIIEGVANAKAESEDGSEPVKYRVEFPFPSSLVTKWTEERMQLMVTVEEEAETREYQYGTLVINPDEGAYVIFEGDYWDEEPTSLTGYIYIDCEFSRDELTEEQRNELEELLDIELEIKTPEKIHADVLKTGTTYDRATGEITWTVTVTPNDDMLEFPLIFTDTFDTDKLEPVTTSFDVSSGTVSWSDAAGNPAANEYEVDVDGSGFILTLIGHEGYDGTAPIVVKYKTRLTDSYLADISNRNVTTAISETVANTINVADSAEIPIELEIEGNANITIPVKELWMKKEQVTTTSSIVDTIDWKVTVFTNGRSSDLIDLILHDSLSTGLELDATTIKINGELLGAAIAKVIQHGDAGFECTDCDCASKTDCSFELHFDDEYIDDNSEIVITYTTKITNGFFDKINPSDNSITLSNKAWLTFEWEGFGNGGDEEYIGPTVEKNAKLTNYMIRKTGTYNKSDHTVTWTVTVNPHKQVVNTDVTIEDIIPDGLTINKIGTEPDIYVNDTGSPQKDIKSQYVSAQKLTVIYDKSVISGNTASFTFTTTVSDDYKNYWAGNTAASDGIKFTNTAVAEWDGYSNAATNDVYIVSTVLDKALKSYDYENRIITWQVIVNQNGMAMTDVQLIDVLSEKLEYVSDSITVTGVTDARDNDQISINSTNVNRVAYDDNTLTISIGSITQQTTVTFKTKVLFDDNDFTLLSTIINNSIELKNDYDVTVTDDAAVIINHKPLDKKGVLAADSHGSEINYSVHLNPLKLSIDIGTSDGLCFKDVLPKGLSLALETVKLYTAAVKYEGAGSSVTPTYEKSVEPICDAAENMSFFTVTKDEDGNTILIVTIPEQSDDYRDCFVLEYSCAVDKPENGNKYSNKVSLTGFESAVTTDITEEITISGAGGAATGTLADKTFSIVITKVDSKRNALIEGITFKLWIKAADGGTDFFVSEETTDADGTVTFNALSLNTDYIIEEAYGDVNGYSNAAVYNAAGAELGKLDGYVFSSTVKGTVKYTITNDPVVTDIEFAKISRNDNDTVYALSGVAFELELLYIYEDGDVTDTHKYYATSEAGAVAFRDIPFGTYKLTETPLHGFTAEDYYVVVNTGGSYAVYESLGSVADSLNESPFYASGGENWTLENTPMPDAKLGKIVIDKTDSMRPNICIGGVTFKLEVKDGEEWHYVTEGVTDENGNLVFDRLPVGENGTEYRVTETNLPDGYSVPAEREVTLGEDGGIELQLDLENVPETANITFRKVSDAGTAISGASFELSTDVETESFNENSSGSYVRTATGNANGIVTFDNIPFGEYKLREISVLSGYARLTTVFTVIVDKNAMYTIDGETAIAFVNGMYEITNTRVFPPGPGDPEKPDDPDIPDDPDDPNDPDEPDDPDDPGDTGDPADPPEVTPPTETDEPTSTPPAPPIDLIDFGNTLVPLDDGSFIEFDEDGVPLGKWTYDEVEEAWIFEPIVPTGALKTGESRFMPAVWVSLLFISAGTILWLLVFKCEKRVK